MNQTGCVPKVTDSKLKKIPNLTVRTYYYHHMKVLLNSFHLNGQTLGFYPQT